MKSILLSTLFCAISVMNLNAQKDELTQDYKENVIERLSQLMEDRYVFPEIAQKTSAYLKTKLKDGDFNQVSSLKEFATSLTSSVQEINRDKHMRIRLTPPMRSRGNSGKDAVEIKLDQINFTREMTAGFREVKKFEGNIGYFDLRGFAPVEAGATVVDHMMALLHTCDAIIIDLRKNGGGSPAMVQYLCSYFFDKKVHLNSLYWREGDRTDEFWTTEVAGEKLPDVPLIVLTSNRTFSGAEEFSYNMQTQKRATLIGETTGGGANPGGTVPINEDLVVFIPTGRAINPITGTNWEGVGVIPDFETSAKEALTEALAHAKPMAENYRKKKMEKYRNTLSGLYNHLESGGEKSKLHKLFEQCVHMSLLNEGDINQMGYDYLRRKENNKSELILETNTRLFPNSANVYDSYAEVLAENGKLSKAMINYKKAVSLAEKNNDPRLKLFQKNLQNAKEKFSN